MPGWEEDWYEKDREWDVKKRFEDIESLIKFLSDFNWYDVINP